MKDDSTVQNRSITRERAKERDSEETRAKVREKSREEKKREGDVVSVKRKKKIKSKK